MEFQKYQHVERFGTTETEGITIGMAYVFPKIDGSNGSIWVNEEGVLCAGSRRRHLSLEDDNHGFMKHILSKGKYEEFLYDHPNLRLFGEWLVPHALKTYRDDALKSFYVFDVMDGDEYLRYENYQLYMEEYDIPYVPCIATINNGSYEQFVNWLDKNTFLIQNGKGFGEGIVIKNYDYKNKYGRQTWAKIVTSEFKEKHAKIKPTAVNGKVMVEERIVHKYCTKAFIEKTFEKISNSHGGWSSKYIPELLSRCYHDLVVEESWNFVKEMKNPTVNFKTLSFFITQKIKEIKPSLF